MVSTIIRVLGGAVALLAALALAQDAGPARVQTMTQQPYGAYLTDAQGRTLYLFMNEEAAREGPERMTQGVREAAAECSEQCLQAWPAFTAQQVEALQGVDPQLLYTAQVAGRTQVVYNGWPLYYFARDEQPGQINGQDIHSFGGEWYIVSPAGQPIEQEAQQGQQQQPAQAEGADQDAERQGAAQEGVEQQAPQRQQIGNVPAATAEDIVVPPGYEIEPVVDDLDFPVDMTIGANGEMYVALAGGHTYGTSPEQAPPARILRIDPDGTRTVIYDDNVPLDVLKDVEFGMPIPEEGLVPPVTGITYNRENGLLYIAHRTRYSTLDPETGEFNTIIGGLPSWGEFLNHKAIFGPDGRMYFALSSQGNSGTVDGHMTKVMKIFNKPDAREIPCQDVEVTGADFFIDNPFTEVKDMVRAEVYVELGVNTTYGQVIPGEFWCNGAIYSVNPDGTDPQRIAWGLRSLYGYDFAPNGRMYATQNSGNIMAPRPIYDDWETIYEIIPNGWYGWPDYYSGLPITIERFRRPNDPETKQPPFPHEFSLTEDTRRRLAGDDLVPIQPVIRLPVHSAAEGMIFGRPEFGLEPYEVLVAEFGAIIPYYKAPEAWPGFRVQKIDLITGEIENFAYNKTLQPAWVTGGGGLRRPLQVTWGPDGSLYIVDFGAVLFDETGMNAQPGTGVIWRVTHAGEQTAQSPETTTAGQ